MQKTNNSPKAVAGANDLSQLELFSVSTFARRIERDEETVRRACRDGRIAAVKCGREWRIPKAVAENIFRYGMPIANK